MCLITLKGKLCNLAHIYADGFSTSLKMHFSNSKKIFSRKTFWVWESNMSKVFVGGEGFRGVIFFVGEDPFEISEKPLNFVVISEILSAESYN